MSANRPIPENVGTEYSDGAVGHIVPKGHDITICGEHAMGELLRVIPNQPICLDCEKRVLWGRLGG